MQQRIFRSPEAVLCDTDSLTATFGRFIVEPFEQGWGITMGNALRRVLLSSLEGTAVWAVRIEGIPHEFTSIPGVKEDVTDILLNLKQVRFQMLGEDPVDELELKVQGPAEVKAGDIRVDQRVRVVNPDLHLATLNETGALEMRLKLRRSWGYVSAEENRTETLPLGFIPVDSIHSPVLKAAFHVTETRVGQSTDYDRLILEVTTDGTITPQAAVARAASLLARELQIFQTIEETARPSRPATPVESEAVSEVQAWAGKDVAELGLSGRVLKVLQANELNTVGELLAKDPKEIKSMPGFGRKALQELTQALEERGLVLGANR